MDAVLNMPTVQRRGLDKQSLQKSFLRGITTGAVKG